MIEIDSSLRFDALPLDRLFHCAVEPTKRIAERWAGQTAAPVFTVDGSYTARGWTDWTRGFQVGASLLLFEATGDESLLATGREGTMAHMVSHLTHTGVHDHGFHTISTFGNLLRQMHEGSIPRDAWEQQTYQMAIRVSGAVQAARWTALPDGLGFVHSFNGPHSLFADTIRSMRVLAAADLLGGGLLGENDRRIDLLARLLRHAETTARYIVYFGDGRDRYDVAGRVAHEAIFNVTDGEFRCPSTQQGYSPFTTWTRALAWVILGYAELVEYLATVREARLEACDLESLGLAPGAGKAALLDRLVGVARVAAEFFIATTPTDGVPFWDTGAPGIREEDLERPSNPFHDAEPVDSSAAAIAAQGLLRLGRHLADARYTAAGLTVLRTLLDEPYLSTDPDHDGLLLHSVYHRPNGWDHVPAGRHVPCGEATMWGDYHLLELGLLAHRDAQNEPWLTFHNIPREES